MRDRVPEGARWRRRLRERGFGLWVNIASGRKDLDGRYGCSGKCRGDAGGR